MENLTGNKLTHMTHLEDGILNGKESCSLIYNALSDTYDALLGNTPKNSKITTKIDGSPSCLAASDFNGMVFIATKSFFNKTRVYCTSEEEIEEHYGSIPDLAKKLKALFRRLVDIHIPSGQIWQGDFLFHRDDLKEEKIDGETLITFQPNTIIYAVDKLDPIYSLIKRAEVGIAWHTVYEGPNFDELKISFSANVDNLSLVPEVFQMDPKLPSIAKEGTLSLEESISAGNLLSELKNILNTSLPFISSLNSDIILLINTYRNYLIKQNSQEPTAQNFKKWLYDKYQKLIDDRKTEKGKGQLITKRDELLNWINKNEDNLGQIYSAQSLIVKLKDIFISHLNKLGNLRTFVKYIDKGYLPVGQEGFAISDVNGNVYKLVSRLEFSKNNFSQDIVKGWMSDKRALQMHEYREADIDLVDFILKNGFSLKSDKSTSNKTDLHLIYDNLPTNAGREKGAQELVSLVKEYPSVVDASYIMQSSSRPVVTITKDDKSQIKATIKPSANASKKTEDQESKVLELLYKVHELGEEDSEDLIFDSDLDEAKMLSDYLDSEPYYYFRSNLTIPENIENIFNKIINPIIKTKDEFIKNFGVRGNINSWNPSDIYVCKQSAYNNFLNEYKPEIMTLTEINALLYKYQEAKEVIGISLKKSSGNLHIEQRGYGLPEKHDSFKLTSKIWFPNPVIRTSQADSTKNISFIVNDNIKFQYRQFKSDARYCQLEIMESGSAARSGKTPQALLASLYSDFNIPTKLNSMKDLIPLIKEVFYSDLPFYSSANKGKQIIPLNLEQFTEYAIQMDSLDFKNNNQIDMLNNEAKYLWKEYAKFMLFLSRLGNQWNDIIELLYNGSVKNTNLNAPHIKIS